MGHFYPGCVIYSKLYDRSPGGGIQGSENQSKEAGVTLFIIF